MYARTVPRSVAANRLRPLAGIATCVSAPASHENSCVNAYAASNSFNILSDPTPYVNVPSGLGARHEYEHSLSTFSCMRLKSFSSHSYTAPSKPAVVIFVSSGDQHTVRTFPLCPRKLPTFSHVYMLYT